MLAKGVVGLGNHFSNVLDYINPFSEKFILSGVLNFLNPTSNSFILKGVIGSLGNMLDYINPFSENFILKNVINFLGDLVSYINPFSDNFLGKRLIELFSDLFEKLFIPTSNQFEVLKDKFYSKFGFISQIKELVNSLFAIPKTRAVSTPPKWEITYMGTTVNIIDFTAFEQYRGVVHGIIIAVMYIPFLLRLYRRLPGIIGGFHVENNNGGGSS